MMPANSGRCPKEGADYVRAAATEEAMPGIALTEGALEVSNVDAGETLISRLQTLGEDFETEVEGWQIDRVRDQLRTGRYFHGIYYPRAFQIDGRKYLHGLAAMARRAGVRIFEDTPVVSIDPSGIRKRIVTPSARLRASHIVLAGNVHLGAPLRRLSETLLPVWRYAAVTEPLGERLAETIAFQGSVMDSDGIDHFRIVDGDRLMWASPETTWDARPKRFAGAIQRRISTVFPKLGKVPIADVFGGAVGVTVHGMPQIGQLRRGLWVASGFGRQGLNTSAMAGPAGRAQHLVGRRALAAVFAVRTGLGGRPDRPRRRTSCQHVDARQFCRGRRAGPLPGAGAGQERIREARLAEANRQAGHEDAAAPPSAARAAPSGAAAAAASRRRPSNSGAGEGTACLAGK